MVAALASSLKVIFTPFFLREPVSHAVEMIGLIYC
jgi:hypothetical protein